MNGLLLLRDHFCLCDSVRAMPDVCVLLLPAHHFAILWASVGNTVPATFWAMYYLVSHPEALQEVRQELQDVLRLSGVEFSPDKDVALSREQLEKLVYLGMSSQTLRDFRTLSLILNETIRPQKAPSTRASACPRPP